LSGEASARVSVPERWTILEMIRWSAGYLEEKGVESGRLDAEHLLAESLGVKRLQLYLQFERPLTADERADFKPLLLRRAAREPLQYIIGHTQFRELEVKTDRRGLIPRPETEMLVQEVLDWSANQDAWRRRDGEGDGGRLAVLDVGTGTGVIALSLAMEGSFGRIVATDLSAPALALARENAEVNGIAEVEFREGDLFRALGEGERFDIIVSNPPYVEEGTKQELQPEVRDWEPESALFAGEDGLDVIGPIADGVVGFLNGGGLLALEVGSGQTEAVRDRIASIGEFSETRIRRDLSGRPRFVMAERA
jgi:release factor glutamine methyltransferase